MDTAFNLKMVNFIFKFSSHYRDYFEEPSIAPPSAPPPLWILDHKAFSLNLKVREKWCGDIWQLHADT